MANNKKKLNNVCYGCGNYHAHCICDQLDRALEEVKQIVNKEPKEDKYGNKTIKDYGREQNHKENKT